MNWIARSTVIFAIIIREMVQQSELINLINLFSSAKENSLNSFLKVSDDDDDDEKLISLMHVHMKIIVHEITQS